MKSSVVFLFAFFSVVCLDAQTYLWAKGEGGIGNDAANGISTDADGNLYVTGNFAGLAEFSGQSLQGANLYDIFIAKYDGAGNLAWVKNNGGVNNEQGNSIKVKGGFIYVCGFFEDSCYFGNQLFLVSGEADAFLAKYDLNGNLVWVRKAGGTGFDYASALDVDDSGNVYICGSYENSMVFDTATISTTNLFSESFIAKYNSSGNLIWTKSTRGTSTNQLTGLAVDQSGRVYCTGFFGGSFKIGNSTINSQSPSYDILIARLDASGNPLWMKRAGSGLEDAANAICLDNNDHVYIGGYFAGTAFFDNNTVTYYDYNDAFVARYDSSGNNQWVRAGKGPELDAVWGLVADEAGNVFATGLFESSLEMSGTTLTGPDRDVFTLSYDIYGNLRWATSGGGIQTDCGLGIAFTPDEKIAVCGYYLHTCSFGTVNLDYADANDLFLLKYSPPAVSIIKEVEDELRTLPGLYTEETRRTLSVWVERGAVFKIFDLQGRLVFALTGNGLNNIENIDFERGMYIIGIYDLSEYHTRKIIFR